MPWHSTRERCLYFKISISSSAHCACGRTVYSLIDQGMANRGKPLACARSTLGVPKTNTESRSNGRLRRNDGIFQLHIQLIPFVTFQFPIFLHFPINPLITHSCFHVPSLAPTVVNNQTLNLTMHLPLFVKQIQTLSPFKTSITSFTYKKKTIMAMAAPNRHIK